MSQRQAVTGRSRRLTSRPARRRRRRSRTGFEPPRWYRNRARNALGQGLAPRVVRARGRVSRVGAGCRGWAALLLTGAGAPTGKRLAPCDPGLHDMVCVAALARTERGLGPTALAWLPSRWGRGGGSALPPSVRPPGPQLPRSAGLEPVPVDDNPETGVRVLASSDAGQLQPGESHVHGAPNVRPTCPQQRSTAVLGPATVTANEDRTLLEDTKPQVRWGLTCGGSGGRGRGRNADVPIFSRRSGTGRYRWSHRSPRSAVPRL